MVLELAVLIVCASLAAAVYLRSLPRRRFVRGRRLGVRPEEKGGTSKDTDKTLLTWGGQPLPPGAETSHFLVTGTTGSGKTLTITSLMARVLPSIREGTDSRALIFDAKQETLPLLARLGVTCPVLSLNPFDARSSAWDIASDVTSPATVLQVATAFIPEEDSANRYFSDAARTLLVGVMQGLIDGRPGVWTLADVLRAVRDREELERVLARGHGGEALLGLYFREERTLANIISTLHSRLAVLEPIAALWERSRVRVGLLDWAKGEGILILGFDETVRAPLAAVNRVIFKCAVDLVLGASESRERRSWFFLDEVREAGRLEGLSSLLTRGRSKGACVVLGFQDIAGLEDVYGERVAGELAGMCSHKAFLRLESAGTAEWAARCIGQFEAVGVQRSVTRALGAAPRSRTVSEHMERSEAVLAAELLTLPPASLEAGVPGYFLSPYVGAYRATVAAVGPWAGDEESRQGARVLGFVPRSAEEQRLVPAADRRAEALAEAARERGLWVVKSGS